MHTSKEEQVSDEFELEEERETNPDDLACGHPCPPDNPCTECASYWRQQIAEGLWDPHRGRWTNKVRFT